MKAKWRLIVEDKSDGYYNMAADETILYHYPLIKKPALRVYGWRTPFISLGYNQDPHKILTIENSVSFVRRITGGAAILHDRELTYSITCSKEDMRLPSGVKESYKVLCEFILHFYSRLGIEAKFACDVLSFGLGGYSDFCFSSVENFDLMINNKKIGGNAQRRKKNIIFQHGSIPQQVDFDMIKRIIKNAGDLKDRVTCLDAILKRETNFFDLRNNLIESFQKVFDIDFSEEGFSQEEIKTRDYLIENKYKTREWNFNEKAGLVK